MYRSHTNLILPSENRRSTMVPYAPISSLDCQVLPTQITDTTRLRTPYFVAEWDVLLSESPHTTPGWKRLDGVDLLRGLAIFFVLMNHVNMRLVIAKIPTRPRSPLYWFRHWSGTVSSAFRFSLPSQASLSLRQRFDAGDRWPA